MKKLKKGEAISLKTLENMILAAMVTIEDQNEEDLPDKKSLFIVYRNCLRLVRYLIKRSKTVGEIEGVA